MFNVRLAGDHLYGTSPGCLFFLMVSFCAEMSWMRSGTELRQFLRVFLPILMKTTVISYLFESFQQCIFLLTFM